MVAFDRDRSTAYRSRTVRRAVASSTLYIGDCLCVSTKQFIESMSQNLSSDFREVSGSEHSVGLNSEERVFNDLFCLPFFRMTEHSSVHHIRDGYIFNKTCKTKQTNSQSNDCLHGSVGPWSAPRMEAPLAFLRQMDACPGACDFQLTELCPRRLASCFR